MTSPRFTVLRGSHLAQFRVGRNSPQLTPYAIMYGGNSTSIDQATIVVVGVGINMSRRVAELVDATYRDDALVEMVPPAYGRIGIMRRSWLSRAGSSPVTARQNNHPNVYRQLGVRPKKRIKPTRCEGRDRQSRSPVCLANMQAAGGQ